MSPPAFQRAEQITRDAQASPRVAPPRAARTAQRAVPTPRQRQRVGMVPIARGERHYMANAFGTFQSWGWTRRGRAATFLREGVVRGVAIRACGVDGMRGRTGL